MSENGDAAWVAGCKEWTGQAVMNQIHGLVCAAASQMGTHDSGGDKICVIGKGPAFTVEATGLRLAPSASVQFACGRTDGNQFGEPNCIVAATATGPSNEPTIRETVARLALDCASGRPCLVVNRTADGSEIEDGWRQVTVGEFAREILLPVLFPDLVAVDHSRDGSTLSARSS